MSQAKRDQALFFAGIGMLVVSIVMSRVQHSDLALGLSFGVSIGLLLLALFQAKSGEAFFSNQKNTKE